MMNGHFDKLNDRQVMNGLPINQKKLQMLPLSGNIKIKTDVLGNFYDKIREKERIDGGVNDFRTIHLALKQNRSWKNLVYLRVSLSFYPDNLHLQDFVHICYVYYSFFFNSPIFLIAYKCPFFAAFSLFHILFRICRSLQD